MPDSPCEVVILRPAVVRPQPDAAILAKVDVDHENRPEVLKVEGLCLDVSRSFEEPRWKRKTDLSSDVEPGEVVADPGFP